MDVVSLEKISLLGHRELHESWLHSRIADDPSILGLGPLILMNRERPQRRTGRLDLLLQDPEHDRRYEVGIQLGKTDETHIIRTIEFWAYERKQFPQGDHCAVIVAEEISSRFLNVIGLVGSSIPLIAIEMSAFKIGEKTGLHFTTVLNGPQPEFDDESDDAGDPADRAYWELKAGAETVGMADRLFAGVRKLDPSLEMRFLKRYIGLARHGVASNFAIFKPRKSELLLELELSPSAEVEKLIEGSGLVLMDAGVSARGRYRLRLTPRNLDRNDAVVLDLVKLAFESGRG